MITLSRLISSHVLGFLVTSLISVASAQSAPKLIPHKITLAKGKSFTLNLADGYEINVAAEGLKRVRFMARSPDNRIFVTDMFNLTDNRKGAVYILDDFDLKSKRFKKVTPYLSGLRNPNSVAFYRDSNNSDWFYLALTDRLVRYRYQAATNKPTGEPEVLDTYPDYGLSYKYGGWHLTRTIAVGDNGKIYVSVGSSCNSCEEKEAVRATVVEMEPDGKNKRFFARGLRNAVGLKWIDGTLYATNMGADHLGPNRPADTLIEVKANGNYGWPYCFQTGARIFTDPKLNPSSSNLDCSKVVKAFAPFPAHSSPLGLEYFDSNWKMPLRDSFLVALHGSTTKSLNRGYKVVSVSRSGRQQDFLTGFIQNGVIHGRPCDVFRLSDEAFLITDDRAGVIYYISRSR
ncbi:MAG TPA: PQQ-dependent sugar dehydrogenase [Pyrinomonadaceae bacterium]|nr:PQQ-dependent sugar dehydrogenase [Pyrinomonadaceae bacterium]